MYCHEPIPCFQIYLKLTLCQFETDEVFDHRELGAMKVAEGTQAFMFETSLQLAVTKVTAQS